MNNQNVFLARRKKLGLKWATALLLLLTFLPIPIVHAAILHWNSDYQLTGADGVLIDGWSYNVRFIDSSCDLIWSGCDQNTFLFKTEEDATKASQALLDQVLRDFRNLSDFPDLLFDSVPDTTAGIEGDVVANIATPWKLDDTYLYLISAQNNKDETYDRIYRDLLPLHLDWADYSFSNVPYAVYARWSVPEPTSVTLLAVGLIGLNFLRRKHKQS